MDREIPNFNVFLNSSNIKSSLSSSEKNQNKNVQNTNNNIFNGRNINSIHQIQQSEFPTSHQPVLFYKVKDRLSGDLLTSRIGYRVRQFSRVEQDYICYLTQLMMTEIPWLKIFLIEPNYLYFQISSMSISKQSSDNTAQNQQQQNVLQNQILNLLKSLSQQVLNPWMDKQLISEKLISQQFDEQQLVERFENDVIKKVVKLHDSAFNINAKYTHSFKKQ